MKQSYREFSVAKIFVIKLKLTGKTQWILYCKSGNKPKDIPNWPDAVYKNKGWISWSDFFGTNYVATYLRKYKSFSIAKKFVQTLKLENQTQWRTFTKSGKLPVDIPRDPPTVYKKEWKGWGDWLRDGKKIERKSKFLQFIPARKYVRKLKLTGQKQWNEKYLKSNKKPDNIPASPQSVYKKEWKGWGDWLGTGRISNKDRVYRDFKKAREFVRKLKFTSYTEWVKYRASEKRPVDIPSMPERVYKNNGWKGYGDFLGTGRGSKMIFWGFEKSRKFVQKLKIKSKEDFTVFHNSGKLVPEIPKNPPTAFKKQWKGWGDFLGTGTIANQNKIYPSIDNAKKDASQLAKKYNLKTQADWIKAHREGKIPKHLPANPWHVYSKKRKKK